MGVCIRSYFSYYFNGKKHEKAVSFSKKITQEAERKMKVNISEGTASVPTLWANAIEQLERTYGNLSSKTVSMYENSLNKLGQSFDGMKLTDMPVVFCR